MQEQNVCDAVRCPPNMLAESAYEVVIKPTIVTFNLH